MTGSPAASWTLSSSAGGRGGLGQLLEGDPAAPDIRHPADAEPGLGQG